MLNEGWELDTLDKYRPKQVIDHVPWVPPPLARSRIEGSSSQQTTWCPELGVWPQFESLIESNNCESMNNAYGQQDSPSCKTQSVYSKNISISGENSAGLRDKGTSSENDNKDDCVTINSRSDLNSGSGLIFIPTIGYYTLPNAEEIYKHHKVVDLPEHIKERLKESGYNISSTRTFSGSPISERMRKKQSDRNFLCRCFF